MYGFFLYMSLGGILSSGWGPKCWRGSPACPQFDPSRMAAVHPLIVEAVAQRNFDRLGIVVFHTCFMLSVYLS